jgi:uncharacterized protein YcfJ
MSFARLSFPLLLAAAPVLAQENGGFRDVDGYGEPAMAAPVEENVSYGYAQVLRADQVSEVVVTRTPEERCDPQPVQPGRTTGSTVVGAIVGAALGNQVGKGNGRKAATVAGAVAGGVVGHSLAERRAEAEARGCRIVEVERQERRVVGYDVEYMYKGEKYMSRLPYDPGNRVRIRVSVTPDSIPTAGR